MQNNNYEKTTLLREHFTVSFELLLPYKGGGRQDHSLLE